MARLSFLFALSFCLVASTVALECYTCNSEDGNCDKPKKEACQSSGALLDYFFSNYVCYSMDGVKEGKSMKVKGCVGFGLEFCDHVKTSEDAKKFSKFDCKVCKTDLCN